MNAGVKILIVLIVIIVLDLICTIIAMTAVPTWNPFIVFGIFFVVAAIAIGFIYLEYFE